MTVGVRPVGPSHSRIAHFFRCAARAFSLTGPSDGADSCEMRILVAFIVVALAGCGGSDHTDPLIGSWALTVNSCAVGFTFAAPAAYEYDLICPTPSGALGMESELGTYKTDANRIVFSVDKTTCAGSTKGYYVEYGLSGTDRLSIIYTDGVEVLQRTTPMGTGLATFGCWTMGSFTSMPLAPLP